MASDKDKILKGIRFMAMALPLIFTAPGLYYLIGLPAYQNGNYFWIIICIVLMLIAVFLAVKGLSFIVKGFFND